MVLPNNLAAIFEQMAKLPQQKIAQAISVLLLVYIAYVAAKTTWMLVPEYSPNGTLTKTSTNVSADRGGINVKSIQNLNLFGIYNQQPVQNVVEVEDAPETNLNLTLSGLVASDEESIAAAVIENNGTQETYGIGDIITGTRATLAKVLRDRVLIKQSGRMETLMLDGFDYDIRSAPETVQKKTLKPSTRTKFNNKQRISPLTPSVLDQRGNKKLTQSAKNLRADLDENPGKITDYLKIIPKRESGNIVGYQLRPGRNPEFFNLSGLQPGDVAVQMNGYDLTVAIEAAQALKALKSEQEVTLLVDRKGEITQILFSINE